MAMEGNEYDFTGLMDSTRFKNNLKYESQSGLSVGSTLHAGS